MQVRLDLDMHHLWLCGAIMTLLMDLTSNACMQPYKMIIGDMVNENKEIWPGHGNKSSQI